MFCAMKWILSLLAACLATVSLHAAEEAAIIETSKGNIVVEFWPDVAPKTVAQFKKLAKSGFYDGTAFHRIVEGFMAQGGDPLTKDPSKESAWGSGGSGNLLPAEFNSRKHTRGVLSMARSIDPNSADSQFFLMFGPAPHLDGQYSGFGQMISGEETLAKIEATPVTMARTGEVSKPTERVEIKTIKIVPLSEVKK